jgi:hypothetical protein
MVFKLNGLLDENSEKIKYKVNSFGYISKSIILSGSCIFGHLQIICICIFFKDYLIAEQVIYPDAYQSVIDRREKL